MTAERSLWRVSDTIREEVNEANMSNSCFVPLTSLLLKHEIIRFASFEGRKRLDWLLSSMVSALRIPLMSGFGCTASHSNCFFLFIVWHNWIRISLIDKLCVNATILCAWHLLVKWSDQTLMIEMSAESFVATLDTFRVIVPRVWHRTYPLCIVSPWHLVHLRIAISHINLLGKWNHSKGERPLPNFRVDIDKDVIVWPILLDVCILHSSWDIRVTDW